MLRTLSSRLFPQRPAAPKLIVLVREHRDLKFTAWYFRSYSSTSISSSDEMSGKTGTQRLFALREMMKEQQLDAYIVPSEDAHASEYLAPCDSRRAFITGFTGSAGCAAISRTEALYWTDGRYWLQAEKQLGPGWRLMKQGLPETPTWAQWLLDGLQPMSKIGIDPTVIPFSETKNLSSSLANSKSTLIPIKDNLIDVLWPSRPQRPKNPIFHLDVKFTGQSVSEKLSILRDKLNRMGSPGMVVTQLDEVAWMFNLRGSDITYNPVFFAYAILASDDCTLFAQPESLDESVRQYLHDNGVTILAYDQIWSRLESLGSQVRTEREARIAKRETERQATQDSATDGKEIEMGEKVVKTDKVLLGNKASWAVAVALGEDNVEVRRSMIEEAKARKNATEIEGFRQANVRDGAALVRYFAWLEEALVKGEVWTEYDAATILENYRRRNELFMGLSFETISSSGPNAAIIHYAPPEQGSAVIDRHQMYLCDSGAQYLDGTTDTTRTWHFGSPTDEEKRAFTRVLQGNIGESQTRNSLPSTTNVCVSTGYRRFPSGYNWLRIGYTRTKSFVVRRSRLQVCLSCLVFCHRVLFCLVSSYPLVLSHLFYLTGLNRHATSHGIGAFLNVHEGPHGVGQRPAYNQVPLQDGMVMSNEPGYYADGKFGIRIENVDIIKQAETRENFGGKGYLELENVTMCPIQTSLVQLELLSPDEKNWLNNYHVEVREKVSPVLKGFGDERALTWLDKYCREV
ncbi:peptidase M24, structural domain-containing protein [Naematelia encephala]|uniref:Peptidase M24, structural domain-containing protein n=1 Tax=Naematelia encephala TaxID=71784 RepID=A0A1Y2ARH3_9TREE|nr:peptidase M24, structural domain-containing protein [Naematelia encephala]